MKDEIKIIKAKGERIKIGDYWYIQEKKLSPKDYWKREYYKADKKLSKIKEKIEINLLKRFKTATPSIMKEINKAFEEDLK